MNGTKHLTLAALFAASLTLPAFAAGPLPSWNDTAPKEGSPDFVPPWLSLRLPYSG